MTISKLAVISDLNGKTMFFECPFEKSHSKMLHLASSYVRITSTVLIAIPVKI